MRKRIGVLVVAGLCCIGLNAAECSKEQIARVIKEGVDDKAIQLICKTCQTNSKIEQVTF